MSKFILPPGQLAPTGWNILPPALVIFTPGASCPGWFILPSRLYRENFVVWCFTIICNISIIICSSWVINMSIWNDYFKHSVGFLIDKGWGESCPGWFILPPPRISKRMDNQQFLLHHLLQKYLAERDINFISVNLRCLLQMFIRVTYWQRVGGKLSRLVYLAPPPPKKTSERMDNPQILLHHLLQEYLVERDINIISVNMRRLLQMFSWVTYWQGLGGQAVQGSLSCPPPLGQG